MPIRVRIPQVSFASGELSPELYGRFDLAQYANGLKTCSNFIVKPHGSLVNRPGLQHVCEVKDSLSVIRLIPFQYNVEQTYTLEFGDYYMRVIANGGLITETAVTITSTTAADPVSVTATGHGYSTGDIVYITGVGIMDEINDRWFTISYVDPNTFTLDDEDGSGYTAGLDGTAERAYVIETPYAEADLFDITYMQSADVMTLFHEDYATRELTRTSDTSWSISEVTWKPSISAPTNLAVDGGSGDYTYAVTAISEETGEESAPATVTSDYSQPETLSWDDVTGSDGYNVYRDDGGSYRKPGFIGTTESSDFEDPGSGAADEIEPEWAYSPPEINEPFGGVQIAISSTTAADPVEVTTSSSHGYSTGDRVYIDGVTTADELNGRWFTITKVDATKFTLDDEDGTGYGAGSGGTVEKFDGNGNCPRCGAYYEQRLVAAGTTDDPQKIVLSQSAAFHNLYSSRPAQDNDAIFFTIAAQKANVIRHVVAMRDLLIFTSGAEWRANGGASEAITATGGLAVRQQTDYGSGSLPPLVIANAAIFYQERGPAIRNISYSFADDQYVGADLSILSKHLFEGYTLVDWCYSQAPNSLVWAVRSDGKLACLTYQHEHKVWAWHLHETEGTVESICSIQEDAEDAVYVVVSRTINGTDVKHIERLHSRYFTDVRDCFFIDDGLTLDNPITITGITAAEPPVVTAADHGLSQDDYVDISDVEGMTEVNDHQYRVNWILDTAENIEDITQALPANVQITGHPYSTGDRVYIESVVGMTEVNDREFTITKVDADNFTLDYEDSTGHTAYTSGGTTKLIDPDTFELADASTGDDIDGSAYTAYESDGYARKAVLTITGLHHLEAESATILANGMKHPNKTVSDGSITLDYRASRVHVGLGYTSEIETLDPEIKTQEGSKYGTRQNVSEVTLRVQDSIGAWIGPDSDNLKQVPFRESADYLPIPLYTGDKIISITPNWDYGARVVIQQQDPLPLAINAIISEVQVGS